MTRRTLAEVLALLLSTPRSLDGLPLAARGLWAARGLDAPSGRTNLGPSARPFWDSPTDLEDGDEDLDPVRGPLRGGT